MDLYVTEIKAESPLTGEIKTWCGPSVPGISFSDAQQHCEENGLGYCKVIGLLVMEVPCIEGTHRPDWKNAVDYEPKRLN